MVVGQCCPHGLVLSLGDCNGIWVVGGAVFLVSTSRCGCWVVVQWDVACLHQWEIGSFPV